MSVTPVIKQIPGGYACEYKNADGSVTNFTGASYEEIIGKLATAHSSATDALARTRKQSADVLKQAREAEAAANVEKVILSWLRTAGTEYGGDFYVCAANNDLLLGWLKSRELAITTDNLTMAFRTLQEASALAPAPVEQQPEPEEAPLPPTPAGYPEVNTLAEVRALRLRDLLDTRIHRPDVVTAFKHRIDAIIARESNKGVRS